MGQSVVYAFLSAENREKVLTLLPDFRNRIIPISCEDWNRDLSPWPAKRAFSRGEDFSGGADAFLLKLIEEVIPNLEQKLDFVPERRYLAGYSLAGLFSLYAATKTDLFAGVASVSGSLWFDDFTTYLAAHPVNQRVESVYLSVGKREKDAKDARMKLVEEKTKACAEMLSVIGIHTRMELNPGGHFFEVPERIAKGIEWVLRSHEDDRTELL